MEIIYLVYSKYAHKSLLHIVLEKNKLMNPLFLEGILNFRVDTRYIFKNMDNCIFKLLYCKKAYISIISTGKKKGGKYVFNISYTAKRNIYFIFLALLAVFFVFLIAYHKFQWRIAYQLPTDCLFHEMFHLYCPGCGGTRALDAFLQGEFYHSFLYQPFILYVAIILGYYYICAGYTFFIKRDGKIYYRIPSLLLIFAAVLVILNFIVRNILLACFQIDFLQDLIVYWR